MFKVMVKRGSTLTVYNVSKSFRNTTEHKFDRSASLISIQKSKFVPMSVDGGLRKNIFLVYLVA